MQLPGNFFGHALSAAVYGHVGDREEAAKAVRDLLVLRPDFGRIARDHFEKWYLPDLVEQLIDGVRKAGLDIPPANDPR